MSFEGLKAIEELHLDNNHFEGEIPDIFDHLPEITNLHLQLNKLKGPIPRTVWHLHDLSKYLFGCNLRVWKYLSDSSLPPFRTTFSLQQ